MVEVTSMRTYRTTEYLSYLADYLIAAHKPFRFDGTEIEFTASREFIDKMQSEDHLLSVMKLKEE